MPQQHPNRPTMLDMSNPLEASIERARREEATPMRVCTCHYEEVGDAENGPRLSVTPDENCPDHGRFADPDGWAEADAIERGYLLSALHSLAHGLHDVKLDVDDDVALALIRRADSVIARERKASGGEDDGHDTDRAVGRVLDALLLIEGGTA
jgi:hypothetical protein